MRSHAFPARQAVSRSSAETERIAPRASLVQRNVAYPGGRRLAQLAALANHQRVLQRVINTAPPPLPAAANVAPGANPLPADQVHTLRPVAHATVRRVRRLSTAPADPGAMANWKAGPFLKDPSKKLKQNLTRMHAIRGKFGGPSDPNNMFLGTALSNNFSPSSHYDLVEKPLEQYLNGAPRGEARAFDYWVAPTFGRSPHYMEQRILALGVPGFDTYAHQHVPDGFLCSARLHRHSGNRYAVSGINHQHVATDVGDPGGPAAVPPVAPVLPGVLGPGPAAALGHAATAVRSGVATANASTSEGIPAALAYGGTGALLGYAAASLLTGPVGWFAGGLGAAGALYGYMRGDAD